VRAGGDDREPGIRLGHDGLERLSGERRLIGEEDDRRPHARFQRRQTKAERTALAGGWIVVDDPYGAGGSVDAGWQDGDDRVEPGGPSRRDDVLHQGHAPDARELLRRSESRRRAGGQDHGGRLHRFILGPQVGTMRPCLVTYMDPSMAPDTATPT